MRFKAWFPYPTRLFRCCLFPWARRIYSACFNQTPYSKTEINHISGYGQCKWKCKVNNVDWWKFSWTDVSKQLDCEIQQRQRVNEPSNTRTIKSRATSARSWKFLLTSQYGSKIAKRSWSQRNMKPSGWVQFSLWWEAWSRRAQLHHIHRSSRSPKYRRTHKQGRTLTRRHQQSSLAWRYPRMLAQTWRLRMLASWCRILESSLWCGGLR